MIATRRINRRHEILVLMHQTHRSSRNFYERKIVIIFLPINLSMCFAAQKNRLIETVLLSNHNICTG